MKNHHHLSSILLLLICAAVINVINVTAFITTPTKLSLLSSLSSRSSLSSSFNRHDYNTHQLRRINHAFLGHTSLHNTSLIRQRIPLSSTVTATDIDTATAINTNLNDDDDDNNNNVQVSFSHVHLYTDQLEDVNVYKQLEDQLNTFVNEQAIMDTDTDSTTSHTTLDIEKGRNVWESIVSGTTTNNDSQKKEGQQLQPQPFVPFVPQGRDIVKQLIAGLGFRVTGQSLTSSSSSTRNIVLTTKDPSGVQFVISALHNDHTNDANEDDEDGSVLDSHQTDAITNDEHEHYHFDPRK